MISSNRLVNLSGVLDYAGANIPNKLWVFFHGLVQAGFDRDYALELTVSFMQSILEIPANELN